MATLYKRATPPQAMILRMVEGAVKNSCDAHGVPFNPYFARSIAKRAAGTLSAEMPAVLAAKPSDKLGAATILVSGRRAALKTELVMSSEALKCQRAKARAVTVTAAAPLRSLEKWLFQQMRGIKRSGNDERAKAFIDVLRKISALSSPQPIQDTGQ